MEPFAAVVTLAYGLLVLAGGVAGYLKARSKPSLVMGGAFGVLLVACGIAGLRGWAAYAMVGSMIAAFLLVFFSMRFARKRKFMPAGMIAALSLIALAVDLAAWLRASG